MSKHAPILHPARVRGDRVFGQLGHKELVYLGSGRFSSAYLFVRNRRERVLLMTHFGDRSKEVIRKARLVADGPASRHLPLLTCVAGTEDYDAYETDFYRRPAIALTNVERDGTYTVGVKGSRVEKDIHRLKRAHRIARDAYPANMYTKQDVLTFNKFVVAQADSLRVTVSVIDAMEALMYAAKSMPELMMFDSFRPSNVGITKTGTLILTDPMFDYRLLQKHLTTIKRRRLKRAA